MTKKKELQVFSLKNVNELLEKLGLLQDFKEGKMKCFFCEETLTLENIGAFFDHEGKLVFTCDSHACIKKAFSQKGEIR